jgi:cobalt ECF transporter T component CbiQ
VTAPPRGRPRTPDWLLTEQGALCPCGCVGRRRKGSFVTSTLEGGTNLLRRTMFGEDMATGGGLLQRVDPRVKLVAVLGLLVAVGLLRNLPVLAACYAGTVGLAAASRLPVGFFVKRVWLFIPVFTGIVVLPATLSIITPGHVVLPLWSWHGHPQGVTGQGLHGAGLIILRVATSVSLVLLLTLTTRWARLLAALRSVGVPRVFVLVVSMAYRYLFLLLGTVSDMFTARRARTVARRTDVVEGRRFVAASAGILFGKAHQLSEEVYQAMVARGFRGEVRILDPGRVDPVSVVVGVGAAAMAVGVVVVDRWLGV